jgi:type II secretory pathway pseudopilin PulG
LTQAFSRIEASKSAANVRIADAFKNEAGAFDLPSILVGVVVVGVLTAGVLASIFGVIPFAQDKGAQQDLGSIVTAEGVYKAQTNNYTNLDGLKAPAPAGSGLAGDLVSDSLDPAKINVQSDSVGSFAAATKSGSGKIFYITDENTNPTQIDPAVAAADATMQADAKAAIAAVSGTSAPAPAPAA